MKRITFLTFFLICSLGLYVNSPGVLAATVSEIQKDIQEKNSQLNKLNEEIRQLDSQIQTVAKQGQSLQGAIQTLDISGKKLNKEISLTSEKIEKTKLQIDKLGIEIEDREGEISRGKLAIKNTLRKIHQTEDTPIVETLLSYDSMSDFWSNLETMGQFQSEVQQKIKTLEELKKDLQTKKIQSEGEKTNLVSLNGELGDKKKIVEANIQEKSTLLKQTRNQEAAYKIQLTEKQRLADSFLAELNSLEAELRLIIDPGSYPKAGKGILKWPLESVYITQYFGNTAFAKSGAYNGKGHNGVDFKASPGTKVLASLSGTVKGTGNTDLVQGCYSYGQWILIEHPNGLSTLYAHLSLIKVKAGDTVSTGDIIGYSGNTGYSTGPHLHFGVYASQGVKIFKYENSINCKNAVIPIADIKAYLNPIEYL